MSDSLKSQSTPGELAVLGSTGSIGTQTLDVVRRSAGKYRVRTLAAHSNVELLVAQIKEFKPEFVAVACSEAGAEVKHRVVGEDVEVSFSEDACVRAATHSEVHSVVAAMVGFAAFEPVYEAIKAGKHIAQANKEVLVAAGHLLKTALNKSSSLLVPVDSEHNAIFQCLLARGSSALKRVILTASGGPFLNYTIDQLRAVTAEDAIKHPRWNMGKKNSIDSASLMNKGLEVIEASVLFDLNPEQIEVIVHPQSIVHGMVEYEEGSMFALLYEPDMRVPISFALSYLYSEGRDVGAIQSGVSPIDFSKTQSLEFLPPDLERFPGLALCYEALRIGAAAPTVLNAANEVAVEAFSSGNIGFCDMSSLVAQVMSSYQIQPVETIEDIISADAWARDSASEIAASKG